MTAKELAEKLLKYPNTRVYIFNAGGMSDEVKNDFIRGDENRLYIQPPYDY